VGLVASIIASRILAAVLAWFWARLIWAWACSMAVSV
jgi:hypothetical protein